MNPSKNLTLLVLAAGMGSRYGGIKQIDGFGPSGETIMDYSLLMPSGRDLQKSFLLFGRKSSTP